jgi:hypothetical protein
MVASEGQTILVQRHIGTLFTGAMHHFSGTIGIDSFINHAKIINH